jgi:hypothetical protein
MAVSFSDLVKSKAKKGPKTKGQKKARRFNRPRSAAAIKACAERKAARNAANAAAAKRNADLRAQGLPTPWELVKARRSALRHTR